MLVFIFTWGACTRIGIYRNAICIISWGLLLCVYSAHKNNNVNDVNDGVINVDVQIVSYVFIYLSVGIFIKLFECL